MIMALAFGWRRRRCPNSSVVLVVAVEVVVGGRIGVGVKSIFLCFTVSTQGSVSSVQVCSHGQQAQYPPVAGEIHFFQCVMHLLIRRPSCNTSHQSAQHGERRKAILQPQNGIAAPATAIPCPE